MTQLDLLVAKIDSMDRRDKIHMAIVAFVGIVVIIAAVFIMQAGRKAQPVDYSKFDKLESDNAQIAKKIDSINLQVLETNGVISGRNANIDEIRRGVKIIDAKISKIPTDEKIVRVLAYGSDSLRRYFANVTAND